MSRIPFIEARFPGSLETRAALESRLMRFLLERRRGRVP